MFYCAIRLCTVSSAQMYLPHLESWSAESREAEVVGADAGIVVSEVALASAGATDRAEVSLPTRQGKRACVWKVCTCKVNSRASAHAGSMLECLSA